MPHTEHPEHPGHLRRNPGPRLAVRILVPFALGYFLSYFARTVNAVIAPDLVNELNLSAQSLGLLTSVFFLSFAAFQLPLGALLDRYGPRRTEFVLLLIAAAGALLFSTAQNMSELVGGRILIGLGVSACLMAAFKAFTQWFAAERLPLINSIHMTAGGLGALVATRPVEWMLQITDWRGVFMVLAALTMMSALVLLWAPDRKYRTDITWGEQLRGFREVFGDRAFRAVVPWGAASQGAALALQSLWVGPWLFDVAGFERDAVASWLALSACAIIVGFISFGWLADWLRKYGVRPMQVSATGMLLFALCFVLLALPWSDRWPSLWMPFGLFSTSGILTYAVLSQHFPAALAGRVITAYNLLVFTVSFLIQWGMGAIIDLWPPLSNGHFAPQGYRVSIVVLLIMQCVCAAWFFHQQRKWRLPI